MKKCPYCAEQIQDEAIVCRYCGRDLVPPEKPKPPENERILPSAWKQGAKAGTVITVLYAIMTLLTPTTTSELIGDLTLGLLATYLGWTAISAIIVWLWRKLGAGPFIFFSSIILFLVYVQQTTTGTSTPTSPIATTPTRKPVSTATKAPTPTKPSLTFDCKWWYELSKNSVGEEMCVQGFIESATGNTEFGNGTRIYFRNLPPGYTWSNDALSVFYFIDSTHYYPDLEVGNCIYATGVIRINDQGELFMRIDNTNLYSCP